MDEYLTIEQFDETANYLRAHTTYHPRIAITLGSGFGSVASLVEQAVVIPYPDIPHWPISTVAGHSGNLIIGRLEGHEVLVMQGRAHYYEGYSMAEVTFPVRVMSRLGIEIMIVTNAAGAINPVFEPGNLMLITDQLNLIGMAGPNPLRGPNIDTLGPRFPDMSRAYDRVLADLAMQVAREKGLALYEGVYVCLAGPSFETPADLRFLRLAGADAVGMSTVPEVIVARHGGIRVMGISGISNKANLDGNTETTHQEVLEAGQKITPRLSQLITGVLQRL